jgi:hypothetical protein
MTVINKTTLESELQALVDALTVSSTDTDLLSLAAAIAELGSDQENHVPTSADLPVTAPPGSVYYVDSLSIPVVKNNKDEWWTLDSRSLISYQSLGTLWTWGSGTKGKLGHNNTTTYTSPTSVSYGGYTDWTVLSMGLNHSAGVRDDGTLWTWGDNSFDALGDAGVTTSRLTPGQTTGGGTTWNNVVARFSDCAASKTDGTLWFWGLNLDQLLPVGDGNSRVSPVQNSGGGTTWVGSTLTLHDAGGGCIKTDGTLWTWGDNVYGGVGDNSTFTRTSPVTTAGGGTNWSSCAAGQDHMIATKTDGTLWTWGYNFRGQLGDNTTTARSSPGTTVSGGTTWDKVHCSQYSSYAIKTDGTLWSWGYNSGGILGDGTSTNRSSPVSTAAGGTNWNDIGGYKDYMIASKHDGTIWVWGGGETNTPLQEPSPDNTFYSVAGGSATRGAILRTDVTSG